MTHTNDERDHACSVAASSLETFDQLFDLPYLNVLFGVVCLGGTHVGDGGAGLCVCALSETFRIFCRSRLKACREERETKEPTSAAGWECSRTATLVESGCGVIARKSWWRKRKGGRAVREIYGRWAVWVLGQSLRSGAFLHQNSPKTLQDFIPTTKFH